MPTLPEDRYKLHQSELKTKISFGFQKMVPGMLVAYLALLHDVHNGLMDGSFRASALQQCFALVMTCWT